MDKRKFKVLDGGIQKDYINKTEIEEQKFFLRDIIQFVKNEGLDRKLLFTNEKHTQLYTVFDSKRELIAVPYDGGFFALTDLSEYEDKPIFQLV